MMSVGTFREDLYYRIAVLELNIPPLRERQDDIPELVCQQLVAEKTRVGLSEPLQIEDGALSELCSYRWPGNIRQLQNVVARLACDANRQIISAAHVRAELTRFSNLGADTIILPDSCSFLLPGESLDDFSCRVRLSVIEAVKNRMKGNMTQAAQRLGVDRSALYRMIQRINPLAKARVDGRNDLAA